VKKAIVVSNPNSGARRRRPGPAAITRRLEEAGFGVRHLRASSSSDVQGALREALRDESPDETRVIAVGGDGTINAVLPALAGTEFPLCIVPSGTLNALAGELGIPRGLREAMTVALEGQAHRIDLGLANGRPFAQMAGAGFDGAVVHTVVPPANKNMLGCSALSRGARLLTSYTATRCRVTTETTAVEGDAWLALVANARHYTYHLRVAPQAAADDGWLDVWLFESVPAAQVARQVYGLLRGRPSACPGVRHLRARQARLESDPPVFVHVDGDQAGQTPVDISVAPAALTVMIPSAEAARRLASRRSTPLPGGRSSLRFPAPHPAR